MMLIISNNYWNAGPNMPVYFSMVLHTIINVVAVSKVAITQAEVGMNRVEVDKKYAKPRKQF